MSQCGRDVGEAGHADEADGEVTQSGHDLWAVAGAYLGMIFSERHVADPMQAVLDRPVPACPVRELSGVGLCGGEAGDRVHGDGVPASGVQCTDAAGDLDGLHGVREQQPGGDGDDLDAAPFDSPVAAVGAGAVSYTHLRAHETDSY